MIGTNFWTKSGNLEIAMSDGSGLITEVRGATGDKPSGVAGYAVGCIFVDTTTGACSSNTGSTSSVTFTTFGGGGGVPYTGATSDLDMGVHNIIANNYGFTQTGSANTITGATGNLSFANGSDINILGSVAASGGADNGMINITGASTAGPGRPGAITVTAGSVTDSGITASTNGEGVAIIGGSVMGTGVGLDSGGTVSLIAGIAENGFAGNVRLIGGNANVGGGGTRGHVKIVDPSSGNNAVFETSSLSGDQTFTFPDATGTFALTATTVPYTGATTDLDLGGHNLFVGDITADAGLLAIKGQDGTNVALNAYGHDIVGGTGFIGGNGGDVFIRGGAEGAGGVRGKVVIGNNSNSLGAILDPTAVTVTSKTFAFPNVSGTFALLSDIPTPLSAVVTVSSAELLLLNTTPKVLVAAPGAGDYLEFVSATFTYEFGTTPYTVGAATDFQVNWNGNAGTQVSTTVAATGTIDQGADNTALLTAVSTTLGGITLDSPLELVLGGGNPTLGDGTLKVTVNYRVVSA